MYSGHTKGETQLHICTYLYIYKYPCPGRVLDSCGGGAGKDAVQGAGNHRQVVDGRENEGRV